MKTSPKPRLLSHDMMLSALYDQNILVTRLSNELDAARRERDQMIWDAREAQIPQSRISRASGVAQGNLHEVFRKVAERKAGLRD